MERLDPGESLSLILKISKACSRRALGKLRLDCVEGRYHRFTQCKKLCVEAATVGLYLSQLSEVPSPHLLLGTWTEDIRRHLSTPPG